LLLVAAMKSLFYSLLFSFLAACGGKEATVDHQGSSTNAQTAGKNDPAKNGSSTSGSGGSSTGSGSTTSTTTAPDCTYSYQSSSGGGDGNGSYSCLTDHHYECTAGERKVSCECDAKNGTWGPTGSCTCSDTGVTFDYDCSKACSPLPDEVFAKCNLPVPPPEPAGTPGGSTSSSSGGP
jgi:hypothetical protein